MSESNTIKKPRLILLGAGHVSLALLRVVKGLQFEIWVLDDREEFAKKAAEEGADCTLFGDYRECIEKIPMDTDCYFVCLTRGHRYDLQCLLEIFSKEVAPIYVGMMGSSYRAGVMRDTLAEAGIQQEVIDSLHSPIGLRIHAETPEEIAVSIAAELISARREYGKMRMEDVRILERMEEANHYVLCTITEKHGSAPRSVGTRMLVEEDGRIVGSIGGGIIEAKVRERALLMFAKEEKECYETYDAVSEDVVEGDILCGGRVTFHFEHHGQI